MGAGLEGEGFVVAHFWWLEMGSVGAWGCLVFAMFEGVRYGYTYMYIYL